MKKFLSLLVILFAAFTVVSCGGGNDNGGDKPGPDDDIELKVIPELDTEAQIEVEFWHAMGQANQAIIQAIIDEFNVYYPNITVTQTSMGDYTTLRDTITSGIPANEVPTIAQTYPDHVALYLAGDAVAELDSYLVSDTNVLLADGTYEKVGLSEAEQDQYIDGFWAEGTVYDSRGTMYSVPFNKSTEVLFYNKTIFEKYGYAVPKTWDDILTICEDFVTRPEYTNLASQGKKASVFSIDSSANLFITLTQQWGGEYTKFDSNGKGQYAFNNSESKAAMAFFKENFDKGYFASATYFGADYSSDAFKAQQCIMTIGSSAGASYNSPTDGSFEAGVAAYPQKDMEHAQVIQQGTNVSLFKCSNPQEELAGWLFMKFLTNFESALRWCTETAYFPIRKDVLNSTEYAEHISGIIRDETTGELIERPNTVQLAQKVGLTQQDWFYSNVAFKGSSAARDNAEIIVDQILYGNKSIDDAYKEAMNDLLS